jgi:hypothetical protein
LNENENEHFHSQSVKTMQGRLTSDNLGLLERPDHIGT